MERSWSFLGIGQLATNPGLRKPDEAYAQVILVCYTFFMGEQHTVADDAAGMDRFDPALARAVLPALLPIAQSYTADFTPHMALGACGMVLARLLDQSPDTLPLRVVRFKVSI